MFNEMGFAKSKSARPPQRLKVEIELGDEVRLGVCETLRGIRGLSNSVQNALLSSSAPTFKGHASANEAVKDGRFIAAKKWQTNLLEQTWEDAPKMPLGDRRNKKGEGESGLYS